MRVFVGLSGGVDSSVAAALLKEQGHAVTGVYMKNWTHDIGGVRCPWRDDLTDAASVAARLDIPFKVFDFQAQYRQRVVTYMLAEYQAGRTPNPDIMCNQKIKFKLFLETALEQGAEAIATGHYTRIRRTQNAERRTHELHMAKDQNKDQSYFLYRLSREALSHSLMPLGALTKPEVRKIAKKLQLATADKPDSQGICFVGEVGIKDFLSEYVKAEPGPIKHIDGRTLGQHEGAIYYTIGQRHGLNVGGGLPLYVTGKNMAINTVFVSENLNQLNCDSFTISDLYWINDPPRANKKYDIRLRHLGRLIPGRIKVNDDIAKIQLGDSERAITAGQSAVIYDEERVVGGGVITSCLEHTTVGAVYAHSAE